MKITFAAKNVEELNLTKDYFEVKSQKLEKHLKRFKGDLVYLHGTLEKNPHREEFNVTLSLSLPTVVLHCSEKAANHDLAMNLALQDISRQIEKHIDKLNREKRRQVR